MTATKQLTRMAKRLFRLCLADGSLDETRVRTVVRKILTSGRRGRLALLSRLLRLVRLDRRQHSAEVDSATMLSDDLRSTVETGLHRIYGPDIRISFAQTSTLIGGMRIKAGDDLYDGSINAGLASLERRFQEER